MGKRKRSGQRRTPEGRIKQKWIDEPFVIHTRSMLISSAWEALPDNARRVLDRLEREHLDQGGSENGKLVCTYSDFEKVGIRRPSISLAIRQCVALGFLQVMAQGGRSLSTERYPSLYRLTYVSGKGQSTDATNEWKTVSSIDDAKARLANVASAREYRGQPRSKRKSPDTAAYPGPDTKTKPEKPRAGYAGVTRSVPEPDTLALLPSISCPGGVAA